MNKFSTKHLFFFIIGSCIISITSYSSVFIRLGKNNTWIYALISCLILICFISYYFYIIKVTQISDIKLLFLTYLPNWLTNLSLFIFSIGLLLISIESSTIQANSIHTNYFIDTPPWFCLLFMLPFAGYFLFKNVTSIVISLIITITFLILGNIFLLFLSTKYLDFNYLLPILRSINIKDSLYCILCLLGSLSSIFIILPFLKYLDNTNKLIKNSILGISISILLICFSLITTITTFGTIRADNIFYPEYIYSQNVVLFNFLEFGSIFFIFKTVSLWFIKYILSFYSFYLIYKNKINNKILFVCIYSIVVFICSYLLCQNQYFLFNTLLYLQPILIICFLFIPFIPFTLCLIKSKKRKR